MRIDEPGVIPRPARVHRGRSSSGRHARARLADRRSAVHAAVAPSRILAQPLPCIVARCAPVQIIPCFLLVRVARPSVVPHPGTGEAEKEPQRDIDDPARALGAASRQLGARRDDRGRARQRSRPSRPTPPGAATRLSGPALPGMTNLHSHAFQFAMAGLAETRSPRREDHFLVVARDDAASSRSSRPRTSEAIAAQLFVSLLKGGFTTVTEFHYLHTGPSGAPYADPAEIAWRVLAAAPRPASPAPCCRASTVRAGSAARPARASAASSCRQGWCWGHRRAAPRGGRPTRCCAWAPHRTACAPSRPANSPPSPRTTCATIRPRRCTSTPPGSRARDRGCLAATGGAPVAHLLASLPIDRRVCLIHATHMDAAGDRRPRHPARSPASARPPRRISATVSFPFVAFRDGGGVRYRHRQPMSADAADELRQLRSSQRLAHLKRAVAATARSVTGTMLWQATAKAGAQAAGQPCRAIEPGLRADLVVLDGAHPMLAGRGGDAIADTLVFGPARAWVRDVLVGGRVVIRDRLHDQDGRSPTFRRDDAPAAAEPRIPYWYSGFVCALRPTRARYPIAEAHLWRSGINPRREPLDQLPHRRDEPVRVERIGRRSGRRCGRRTSGCCRHLAAAMSCSVFWMQKLRGSAFLPVGSRARAAPSSRTGRPTAHALDLVAPDLGPFSGVTKISVPSGGAHRLGEAGGGQARARARILRRQIDQPSARARRGSPRCARPSPPVV
ncbi:MAG: hypothetical protein M5U08_13930 [Burkholderiales bacterium]|nr:hypothetical protein [Burkholderiales bacterium]